MMTSPPQSVSQVLKARIESPPNFYTRWVTLSYTSADPYALTMKIDSGGTQYDASEVVTWVFARSLVLNGMTETTGDGDVTIWPERTSTENAVCIALKSPSGNATLRIDWDAAALYLVETVGLCKVGEESEMTARVIDTEIFRLLDSQ